MLTAVATSRTESVAGDLGPAIALNEGFQAGLLVAAGFVVVAVMLHAVVSRGSQPATAHDTAAGAVIVAPVAHGSVSRSIVVVVHTPLGVVAVGR